MYSTFYRKAWVLQVLHDVTEMELDILQHLLFNQPTYLHVKHVSPMLLDRVVLKPDNNTRRSSGWSRDSLDIIPDLLQPGPARTGTSLSHDQANLKPGPCRPGQWHRRPARRPCGRRAAPALSWRHGATATVPLHGDRDSESPSRLGARVPGPGLSLPLGRAPAAHPESDDDDPPSPQRRAGHVT